MNAIEAEEFILLFMCLLLASSLIIRIWPHLPGIREGKNKQDMRGLLEGDLQSIIHKYNLSTVPEHPAEKPAPARSPLPSSRKVEWLKVMPNEVILTFLSFLDTYSLRKCELCCKRLKELASHKSLWRHMDLTSGKMAFHTTNTRLIELAEKHKEWITDVNLNGCLYVDDRGVIELARLLGSGLRNIQIVHCNSISDNSLIALGKNCPSLVGLNCSWSSITDEGLEELIAGCTKIEDLNIGWCSALTDRSIISIVNHGKNIKRVVIDGCGNISTDAVSLLMERHPGLDLKFKRIMVIR